MIQHKTLFSSALGKRQVDSEPDQDCKRARPDWLLVELAVFKLPQLFGTDVVQTLHWDEMGFDQFMDAGFIEVYTDARQFMINKARAAPKQQFGFDGAVLHSNNRWAAVQVKNYRKSISAEAIGAFLGAIAMLRATRPDYRAHIVATSAFTEQVKHCGKMLGFSCISHSASAILAMLPPPPPDAPPVQKTDIDCMQALRPCQQEALDAMKKAFTITSSSSDDDTCTDDECDTESVASDSSLSRANQFVLGLPPGSGKTLVCILFCLSAEARKYQIVVVASPLRAQVTQTKTRFEALLQHSGRTYTSTLVDTDGSTSVDTVCAGRQEGTVHYIHTTYKSASIVASALADEEDVLLIVDEAHRYTTAQLGSLSECAQDTVLVSGTWRSIPDHLLCNLEDHMRYTMTITAAEKAGIIVPQRFVIPCNVDVDGAGLEVQAEFIATATMRLSNGPRRHILYSATVKDAELLAELTVTEFARSGMQAEARVLTGTTPQKERDAILQWVAAGTRKEVRLISSVHVLDEGIDIPAVDCVFISSIGSGDCRYVQRVCRSVRLYPGKNQATVLVWSAPENMCDLSGAFQERADWQSSIICMGPSLETADRAVEATAVQTVITNIQRGIVGFSEWQWHRQFTAWQKARQEGPVTQKQKCDGYHVGAWQNTQRIAYKAKKMEPERIQILEGAGMVWDPLGESWQAHFTAWQKALQSGPVSQTKKCDGYNVGNWQDKQRTLFKKKKMEPERIQVLEAAGMVWDALEETWQAHFTAWQQALQAGPVAYKQKSDGYHVGMWQDKQRAAFKKKKMQPERIQVLEGAGMVWDPHEESWQAHFAAWQKARQEGPVVRKQKCDGHNVGTWQHNQRTAYKAKKMEPERIQVLEAAGMVWDALEETWQAHFTAWQKALQAGPVAYKQKSDGYHVGAWQNTQRIAYKAKKMEPERIQVLEAAGMVWDALEETWQAHFTAWQKALQDGPVTQKQKCDGYNVGMWQNKQRTAYKKKKMQPERIQVLEAAGFTWTHDPSL